MEQGGAINLFCYFLLLHLLMLVCTIECLKDHLLLPLLVFLDLIELLRDYLDILVRLVQ